jgi:hypothetical protein
VAQEQRHPVGVAEAVLADLGINRLRFEVAQDLLSEGARLVDDRQNNALLHPSPLAYSLEMSDGRGVSTVWGQTADGETRSPTGRSGST